MNVAIVPAITLNNVFEKSQRKTFPSATCRKSCSKTLATNPGKCLKENFRLCPAEYEHIHDSFGQTVAWTDRTIIIRSPLSIRPSFGAAAPHVVKIWRWC